MKRAALEKPRTVNTWRKHYNQHVTDLVTAGGQGRITCECDQQAGRFRKGQKQGGCGKARCYMCHGDKLLGLPTISELRARDRERQGLAQYEQEQDWPL